MVHEPGAGPLGDDARRRRRSGARWRSPALAAAAARARRCWRSCCGAATGRVRLLALLDAALPGGARTAAVSLLAVAATFVGARPAAADDSVRGWLGRPRRRRRPRDRAAVATPKHVDQLVDTGRHHRPSPARSSSIPPAVEERPSAARRATRGIHSLLSHRRRPSTPSGSARAELPDLRGAARRLPLGHRRPPCSDPAPTGARSTPVGGASTTPTVPRSVTTRT